MSTLVSVPYPARCAIQRRPHAGLTALRHYRGPARTLSL